MIQFAFKRFPNQDLLVNGKGETMPEPDYEGKEWPGWEQRLMSECAAEVLRLEKEESASEGGSAFCGGQLRTTFLHL